MMYNYDDASPTLRKLAADKGEPVYVGDWEEDSDDSNNYLHVWMFADDTMVGETNGAPVLDSELRDVYPGKYAEAASIRDASVNSLL